MLKIYIEQDLPDTQYINISPLTVLIDSAAQDLNGR